MKTLFYPNLGSKHDLWFLRIAGSGLANGFYNYFHTIVLAEKYGGTVITPPWFSLKIGTILRAERSKRFYFRIFKPHHNEISGINKLIALLATLLNRHSVTIDGDSTTQIIEGKLNVVTCKKFTFKWLHEHRDLIRKHLLDILNDAAPDNHSWGKGNFIGIHVRLGDFSIAKNAAQAITTHNTRIPMYWYEAVIKSLRQRYPDMPIRIFSDGNVSELSPLLSLGAELYRTGSDIGDFLALASSSLLVGSNSTYSHWAVFLGNMPSIWLDTANHWEQPSDPDIPITFVPLEAKEIAF